MKTERSSIRKCSLLTKNTAFRFASICNTSVKRFVSTFGASSILLALVLPNASSAYAAPASTETIGKVKVIRTISQYNQSVVDGQEEVIFKVGTLGPGCTWLAIKATDSSYLSALLSAQAQNRTVRAWYYADVKSPIGNHVCQAVNLELSEYNQPN
jgi:hypothetical protein